MGSYDIKDCGSRGAARSNQTLGDDCVLRNLLTVRNFLIQDISSDIQQCCRRIQHFCTSLCPA
jgi:hypothetical protein